MHLVFLNLEPLVTGGGRIFATVAHELALRGHDTTLALREGGELARGLPETAARVVCLLEARTVRAQWRQLAALLEGRPADVAFVHSDREHEVAARVLRRAGRGALIRRIGAGAAAPPAGASRRAERLLPARLLYTSEAPPTGYAVPSGRLSPTRADLGVTVPVVPAAHAASEWGDGGGPDTTWLACVATREALRRATNVVRAVAFLAQRHHALRLRVVGSAASDPDLHVLASALGIGRRVEWVPQPDAHPQWVRGLAAGWVIADGDDAGLGILHLMANAITVMAERTPVAARYVSHGIHGALFARLEAPLMAAETSVLLAEPERRRAMGAAARARVEREFSLRDMLKGFEHAVRTSRERRTPVSA